WSEMLHMFSCYYYFKSSAVSHDGGLLSAYGSSILFTLSEIKQLINDPQNAFFIILTNVGFPIIAYVVCCRTKRKNKTIEIRGFNQAWLMYLISYSEKIFLTESGDRATHGNYAWGSYFFCSVLHIVALSEMIKLYKIGLIRKKVMYGTVSIFVLEVISGVSYFIYSVNGGEFIL
ncbi:hypothetical protein, partial [Pseudobutyrivibrio ruminis]